MKGLYCTDTEALDDCLRLMFPDQEPDRFRTEGGSINWPRIRSMWNERRDMRLMLQLAERFGVCVGKGIGGDPYVGRPGTKDVILRFTEGEGSTAAAAELLAVVQAIAKVGDPSGVAECGNTPYDEGPFTTLGTISDFPELQAAVRDGLESGSLVISDGPAKSPIGPCLRCRTPLSIDTYQMRSGVGPFCVTCANDNQPAVDSSTKGGA